MYTKAIVVAALLGYTNANCQWDIADIVISAEAIIADVKAGKYSDALTAAVAILPTVEQAYTDCGGKEQKHHFMKQMLSMKKSLKVNKLEDLPTCIADVEAMIPAIEKIIADIKAGNESGALTDLLALEPIATKAYTDCTASSKAIKWLKRVEDLPTCIADIEAAIPDVEKIIADFKAKNYEQALTDALALEPVFTKAYADCTASKLPKFFQELRNFKDLPACIADIEAMIPDVEAVIADFKAGNTTKALMDALKLEPLAVKALADCKSSKKVAMVLTSEKKSMFSKVGDLATCISDIEGMIPTVEKVIADVKAGNEAQALTDLMALEPIAIKAYTDCTSSKFQKRISGSVGDLPTCIADIEALIPGVEKVIAAVKAGSESEALADLLALEPAAAKAYTDCTSSTFQNKFEKKVGDLATCIADIEAIIPGVEKVIADVKAGNESQALADLLALEPEATKAYTDCTAGIPKEKIMHKIMKKIGQISKVEDLATCIADIEAMIPDVEAVIADFKAGNTTKALMDALKLEPLAVKALADCKSGGKSVKGKLLSALKGKRVGDDPKREYFEKIGAEFASGFYAGTHVGHTESIDLYNCLHREPKSVEVFYKADEMLKESFIHKDNREAVKGAGGMFFFIIELIMEDYPHTHTEVCSEFKDKKQDFHFDDLKKIYGDYTKEDTTLASADNKIFFNKVDVTTDAHNVVEAYLKQDFGKMGYEFGDMLLKASNTTMEAIPVSEPTLFLY